MSSNIKSIIVHANKLEGRIVLPPFKSEVIRYFLLLALSGATPNSVVRSADSISSANLGDFGLNIVDGAGGTLSDDIYYALNAAPALISGEGARAAETSSSERGCDLIDVGGSATLLRLMIPPMIAKFGFARFRTDGSLFRRSLEPYEESFGCKITRFSDTSDRADISDTVQDNPGGIDAKNGVNVPSKIDTRNSKTAFNGADGSGGTDAKNGTNAQGSIGVSDDKTDSSGIDLKSGIIEVSGALRPFTEYFVDASSSSQFASGMLLALPLVDGMRLRIKGSMVSAPYLELTLRMLDSFGIEITRAPDGVFYTRSKRFIAPRLYRVEGDHSYAANFLAASFISPGSRIELAGYSDKSAQADADARKLFGLSEISVEHCPDLFPILCVAACSMRSPTVITGTDRLRGKESDRVMSMLSNISALGGRMEAYDDRVVIFGSGALRGGRVKSFGDHRVVMACAIASLLCREPVIIEGFDAVAKSAPNFFNDFRQLGGFADEYIR